MKILITGGCGFLGSNLASHFLRQECEVVVVDSLVRNGAAQNLDWLQEQAKARQLSFYQVDIADPGALEMVFRRHAEFHFVCHVAGQVAMTTSIENPRRDLEVNLLGTFNVLECVRNLSPNAFVAYSSTNKVYGDLKDLRYRDEGKRYVQVDYPSGIPESQLLDFSTPYGCSKGAADQYVRDWARVYGLQTVVFRHSSIYGARQFATAQQGWIGWFCQQALLQAEAYRQGEVVRPFTISGTGKQVRDCLFASDLVRLYETAYSRRGIACGQVYNIGGGMENSLSLLELFDVLAENLTLPGLEYVEIERRQSDQDVFVADIAKASTDLGWAPEVRVSDGVRAMLGWISEARA